ncbi:MAG: hypothetical protein KAR19_18865 [Bacteroidales bacterium]|nr:hypothetical protein [Bacteroidales bacterium]
MAFIRKHLPDPFYLEGDKRISIRERIFREVVVNMLIHREYINAFPAKLIIERDMVFSKKSGKRMNLVPGFVTFSNIAAHTAMEAFLSLLKMMSSGLLFH